MATRPKLPDYHSEESCDVDFQAFAGKLDFFLKDNPPRYDDAINAVSRCEEQRLAYSQTVYGRQNQAHENVSKLLNNLGGALEKLKPTGQPFQVQYADNPMRFSLYSLYGDLLEITSTGERLSRYGGRVKTTRHSRKKTKRRSKTYRRKHTK
jgi:hypothetical protein